MWKWMKKDYPVLYEVVQWGILAMALAAFIISLVLYIRSRG